MERKNKGKKSEEDVKAVISTEKISEEEPQDDHPGKQNPGERDSGENDLGEKKRLLDGPLRMIIGLFLVMLMIFWLVPYYYVKQNPSPRYIPSIDEVMQGIDLERSRAREENITLKVSSLTSSKDMYRLVVDPRDQDVKMIADRIASIACKDLGSGSGYRLCHAKAIFLFVRDRFTYVLDPVRYEYVKTPMGSIRSLGGDCDDASVLLASLLGSIGISTRLVFVPNHVYVEALLPEASMKDKTYKGEDWVALDGACKGCGFGEMSISETLRKDSSKEYVLVT
jgi:hypothetical protein